jgi:predicted thioesterase
VAVEPGQGASVELRVSVDDTAKALGSGDVEVLATPRLVALAEEATVAATQGYLRDQETSVCVRVQIDHVTPIAVGRKVWAEAQVESVHGRRIVFTVSVTDTRGLVAAGRVTRVVVDRSRFLEKAQ